MDPMPLSKIQPGLVASSKDKICKGVAHELPTIFGMSQRGLWATGAGGWLQRKTIVMSETV